MIRWVGVIAALGAAGASPAFAQEEDLDAPHVRLYKKVAPATVAVSEVGARRAPQRGSGVIIDRSGIILTSPTACGLTGEEVNVLLPGGKEHRGRVMGRVRDKELALVKIDAKDLPAVELGDSDRVRVGQVAYVLGDCYESIVKDGQPALSVGIVSSVYEVTKRQRDTYYTGKVIETSAAVNPDQDGGPLLDRNGRLLGIVTLNYDESKFTGIAIPINELKADIGRIRREYEAAIAGAAAPPRAPGEAWLGAEVKTAEGGLEVTRVARNSPAEKAGLRKGDLVTAVDATRPSSERAFKDAIDRKGPGDTVKLTVLRDGTSEERTATLVRKPIY